MKVKELELNGSVHLPNLICSWLFCKCTFVCYCHIFEGFISRLCIFVLWFCSVFWWSSLL